MSTDLLCAGYKTFIVISHSFPQKPVILSPLGDFLLGHTIIILGNEHFIRTVGDEKQCDCHPGFILSEDGHSCIDVDECQVNNGGCDQVCNNRPGTFMCEVRTHPNISRLLNDYFSV